MITTILDIIGAFGGIVGAIQVGRLKSIGYLFFMICNIAYMTLGLLQGFYGLVIVSIVMLVIDIIYYVKWRGEGR